MLSLGSAMRLPRSRLPSLGGQVARNDKKERLAMTRIEGLAMTGMRAG